MKKKDEMIILDLYINKIFHYLIFAKYSYIMKDENVQNVVG